MIEFIVLRFEICEHKGRFEGSVSQIDYLGLSFVSCILEKIVLKHDQKLPAF